MKLITLSFPVLLSICLLLILDLVSKRPPSSLVCIQEKNKDKDKRFRPLYDIPYMFEAREFLRKKLIGKKVMPKTGLETSQTLVGFLCVYQFLLTGAQTHSLKL